MTDAITTITSEPSTDEDAAGVGPLPRLILAFECRNPTAPGVRLSLEGVDEVLIGRGGARGWRRCGRRLEIQIHDVEMSRQHARLLRDGDGWNLTDLDSKNGTYVNAEPVRTAILVDGDLVETGGAVFLYRDEACDLGDPVAPLDRDLGRDSSLPVALRTLSCELERLVGGVRKTARSTLPILVRGETGCGKELFARAIHELSGRAGAFVPVNCGALPRTLIESELFGSTRGAFSGARADREGLVQRAHGGTLFLDEIAELPEESQVALLRVLQDGEVRPVGACDAVRIDVRVVAATHQDLEQRIADRRFRQDLYARLIGYVVTLPSLRERREDIGTLVGTILRRSADDAGAFTFQRHAARLLMEYAYPLNIRELEQALRAAMALSDNREIRAEHLPEAIRNRAAAPAPPSRARDGELPRDIVELLRAHAGNVTAVARRLGKAPVQIRRWCRRYNIDVSTFRR